MDIELLAQEIKLWVTPLTLTVLVLVSTILVFGKKFFSGGVNHHHPDMSGKVVIVTGGNAGIGKETARELARLGASVVIAGRDENKGKEAVDDIQNTTGSTKVDFFQLDLSDLQSVKRFVEKFQKTFSSLHLLINNAGLMATPVRKQTKEGFELQMATNHYGHFLMTNMLLPLLKKSQPSRIINLTSMGHQFAKWNFDDLEYTKSYSPWGAYGNSKLANIYFTTELQRRLKGDKIKVFAVHPGGVRTELGNTFINSSFIIRLFFKLLSPIWWYFSKSVPQGAQTSLYCALADFDKIEGGKYYADCRVGKPTALSQSEENAKKFWDISVAKVGFKEGQK